MLQKQSVTRVVYVQRLHEIMATLPLSLVHLFTEGSFEPGYFYPVTRPVPFGAAEYVKAL